MNKQKQNSAITLIALIITIIVLLILAGVSINFIFGQDGIFNKTQIVVDEYNKAEAQEKANLKVAEKNMIYYSDYQRKGKLAEIAVELENDEEVEYVKGGKPIASTDFSNYSTVIFKLKAYIYEFEMGEDLQVALLDKNNETAKVDGHREINPTGSINITRNGEYDVTNYATAIVDVQNVATCLYDKGEKSSLVGDWIPGVADEYRSNRLGAFAGEENNMLYARTIEDSYTTCRAFMYSENPVDLTNYKTVFFHVVSVERNGVCVGVSQNIPTSYEPSDLSQVMGVSAPGWYRI